MAARTLPMLRAVHLAANGREYHAGDAGQDIKRYRAWHARAAASSVTPRPTTIFAAFAAARPKHRAYRR